MEIESPMVHLPLKRLKNLFSTSTLAIEKDIQLITSKIQSLYADKDKLSPSEASKQLTSLIARLESLQRKAREHHKPGIPPFLAHYHSLKHILTTNLMFCDLIFQMEETNRQEQLLMDHFRARTNNVASFVNSTELCAI
jgi:hypothetical protein